MRPPVPKYELTVVIRGNTHQEIQAVVMTMSRSFIEDSNYWERDEFRVIGAGSTRVLTLTNPGQTPENYKAELLAWVPGEEEE